MEDDATRRVEPDPESQFKQGQNTTADQRASKTVNARYDELGERLQEKLEENARLKRASHPDRKKSSLISALGNGTGVRDRAAKAHIAESSLNVSRANPKHSPMAEKAVADDESAPARLSSIAQDRAVTSSANTGSVANSSAVNSLSANSPSATTTSSHKTLIAVAAVGVIVIGFIANWYLDHRIETDTRRTDVAASEPLAIESKSSAVSMEPARALELADKAFNAGLLTEPEGESALDFYRDALGVDPDNQAALVGVRRITDQLLLHAEAALQSQRFAEATAALQTVREIDPELPLLDLLEAQIARQQSFVADVAEEPTRSDGIIPPPTNSGSEPAEVKHSPPELKQNDEAVVAVAAVPGTELAEQGAFQSAPGSPERLNPEALNPEALNPATPNTEPANTEPANTESLNTKPLSTELLTEAAPDARNTSVAPTQAAVSDSGVEGLVIAAPVLVASKADIDKPVTEKTNPESMATVSAQAAESIELSAAIDSDGVSPQRLTDPQPELAAISDRRKTGVQLVETPQTSAAEKYIAGSEPMSKAARNSEAEKVVPLKRIKWVAPVAPRIAERRGLNGWVEVGFTVTAEGETTDLEIVDANPRKIFDKAAINSVQQWRFEPPVRNGEPVSERANVRIRFVLSD